MSETKNVEVKPYGSNGVAVYVDRELAGTIVTTGTAYHAFLRNGEPFVPDDQLDNVYYVAEKAMADLVKRNQAEREPGTHRKLAMQELKFNKAKAFLRDNNPAEPTAKRPSTTESIRRIKLTSAITLLRTERVPFSDLGVLMDAADILEELLEEM